MHDISMYGISVYEISVYDISFYDISVYDIFVYNISVCNLYTVCIIHVLKHSKYSIQYSVLIMYPVLNTMVSILLYMYST